MWTWLFLSELVGCCGKVSPVGDGNSMNAVLCDCVSCNCDNSGRLLLDAVSHTDISPT